MTPRPFRVQRSRIIGAPASDIVREIVDFRRWTSWSPWEDADPAMTREYTGAPEGVGARYAWSGNRKAGAGSMEITAVEADRSVEARLTFSRPMRADNTVRFDVEPADGGHRVTWVMAGETSGIAGLISRLIPMDRLVGGDFERGLERLDATVTGRGAQR
ncbi:SRPBCC family protein [Williamsia deligens]|uniref:SRPBCC family protein n=1 Tax=Williamsia deligens TaxID=321325 RepID=A0ABW3G9R8_9NOCA|nr:SRPBCC family protein [Williamsia deligens]